MYRQFVLPDGEPLEGISSGRRGRSRMRTVGCILEDMTVSIAHRCAGFYPAPRICPLGLQWVRGRYPEALVAHAAKAGQKQIGRCEMTSHPQVWDIRRLRYQLFWPCYCRSKRPDNAPTYGGLVCRTQGAAHCASWLYSEGHCCVLAVFLLCSEQGQRLSSHP